MTKILLLLEICFFIHIKITEDVEPKGNIVEIPMAIYNRLLYYTTIYFGTSTNPQPEYEYPL